MTEQRVTAYMLVVEEGVRWIPTIGKTRGPATERVFVAQAPGEPENSLVSRVVRRAQELVKRQTPIECAVIAVNNAAHAEVLAARYEMAQALVSAMSGASAARLHFAPPLLLSSEARHSLLSLAGTLATQLRTLSVEVCIRFGARPGPRSALRVEEAGICVGDLSFGAA
ncbi:MAG: hypothetical protein IPI67_38850 [Myxococcales bacterium]|nr:hypothetical protein [Myxococcales bacterium]